MTLSCVAVLFAQISMGFMIQGLIEKVTFTYESSLSGCTLGTKTHKDVRVKSTHTSMSIHYVSRTYYVFNKISIEI